MIYVVRTPVNYSDGLSRYYLMTEWLADRDLQIVTQRDVWDLLQMSKLKPAEWGLRLADELPRYYSHGVYQTYTVDVATFIPEWHVWHFPPWAGDEALLFKLTFAGL